MRVSQPSSGRGVGGGDRLKRILPQANCPLVYVSAAYKVHDHDHSLWCLRSRELCFLDDINHRNQNRILYLQPSYKTFHTHTPPLKKNNEFTFAVNSMAALNSFTGCH